MAEACGTSEAAVPSPVAAKRARCCCTCHTERKADVDGSAAAKRAKSDPLLTAAMATRDSGALQFALVRDGQLFRPLAPLHILGRRLRLFAVAVCYRGRPAKDVVAVELLSLQPFPYTHTRLRNPPFFSLSLSIIKYLLNYRHSDWQKRYRVRAGCAAACEMSSLWLITRFEWHFWASPYCPGQANLIGSGEAGPAPQPGNCIAASSATATFAIGYTLPRGCPQPHTHSPTPLTSSPPQLSHPDASRWRSYTTWPSLSLEI